MKNKNISKISISSKFLRSVNLESDFSREDSLDNYILQDSTYRVLKTLNSHISNSQQRAFTITGPYGCGKSSLALLLASLVSNDETLRKKAKKIVNNNNDLVNAWKTKNGWEILPVVGKRENVETEVSKSLKKHSKVTIKTPSQAEVIKHLVKRAENSKNEGVLVILDELGKFLEYATQNNGDIYFYQELAEAASRCKGNLIVIGILHQSFEQYANKLGKATREEWSKIQGRYVDIPLVTASDEVIELVGKAIESNEKPDLKSNKVFKAISQSIHTRRPNISKKLDTQLMKCWPLHPIVSCLLGPFSRKKYSQNERSIFSFLTSAEPFGFNEFIHSNDSFDMYGPDNFWDYLKTNFEQAIMLSSDSHRWALANDAIERTISRNGSTAVHIKIVKTIALLDIFKNQSGLYPENEIIEILNFASSNSIKNILKDLALWSVLIYKKHLNSWSLYSGSDFDIDKAVNETRQNISFINNDYLISFADLNFVVAKKHYHQTGYIRWCTKNIINLENLEEYLKNYSPSNGSMGEFILVIPDRNNSEKENLTEINKLSSVTKNKPVFMGLSHNFNKLYEHAFELIALEQVLKTYREIEGDSVARQEIFSRISNLKKELHLILNDSFNHALWIQEMIEPFNAKISLTSLATKLAEKIYTKAPEIKNELINKDVASSNVSSARNNLMFKMFENAGQDNLGFDNFSAESSLFHTILKKHDLYIEQDGSYQFVIPTKKNQFYDLWQATDKLFKNEIQTVKLSDFYSIWTKPPFGLKKYILPIIALAYFLSNKYELIFYIEDKYIPELNQTNLLEWMQEPERISFKKFNLSDQRKSFLLVLSEELNKQFKLDIGKTSLDAARAVVSLVLNSPGTSRRTLMLPDSTKEFRNVIIRANDPNKVLFTDLPETLGEYDPKKLVKNIILHIQNIRNFYPSLIKEFDELLLKLIDHHSDENKLRKRAESILDQSGDLETNAFVLRLTGYNKDILSLESIFSVLLQKSPREWSDLDKEKAKNKLSDLCQKFRKLEVNGIIKNNNATRSSFAFVYADPTKKYQSYSYDIDVERAKELDKESKNVLNLLQKKGLSKDEILAVLANACENSVDKEPIKKGEA